MKNRKPKNNIFIFFPILIHGLFCLSAFPNDDVLKKMPHFEEEKIINNNKIDKENIGFAITPLDNLKPITSFNESKAFIPASLNKIVTNVMALKVLGPAFKFKTSLSYKGKIEAQTLIGDLYLKGTGDPIFTSSELFNLALKLKFLGVNKVTGKLILDDSHLHRAINITPLAPLDETYNSGISALSMDFNRTVLLYGKKTLVPNFPNPVFKLTAEDKKYQPGIDLIPEYELLGESWKYSSKKRYPAKYNIPIVNPTSYVGGNFLFFMKLLSIELNQFDLGVEPNDTVLIHQQESKPLIELVELNLEFSNNIISELIFYNASKKLTNKVQNPIEGGIEVKKYYQELFNIPNMKDFNFVDGSGLSSLNTISPLTLNQIISHGINQDNHRNFWSLLSPSGKKGWLEKRYNKEMTYKVWAKTGSLDFVNNLSGIFFSKNNTPYIFSIFVCDFKKRDSLNITSIEVQHKIRNESHAFTKKAQRLQNDLLKYWYQRY